MIFSLLVILVIVRGRVTQVVPQTSTCDIAIYELLKKNGIHIATMHYSWCQF